MSVNYFINTNTSFPFLTYILSIGGQVMSIATAITSPTTTTTNNNNNNN